MSRESDFAARMTGDAALMLILTGGVYQSGLVGIEGITRETTPAAFSGGYLAPCALVVQAGRVPDGTVLDYNDRSTSARQRVQVYIYQDSPGYTAIDLASARIYTLLQGHQATGGFEIHLINELDRSRDQGPLAGASMAMLDFEVVSIIQ